MQVDAVKRVAFGLLIVGGLGAFWAAASVQAQPAPTACTGGVRVAVGLAGAAPVSCLQPKDSFRDCPEICPEMVVVPSGSFIMGSTPAETGHPNDEGPTHPVTIGAPIAVGKLEITRGQFAAFVAESGYVPGESCWVVDAGGTNYTQVNGRSFRDPGFAQDDSHPAVCISWDDAKAYVAWLGKKTGKPYRLLSEAEWEFADRGGTTTPYWFGNGAVQPCEFANGADATAKTKFPVWASSAPCRDGFIYTAPGGSFTANDFGLFDMSGNVWEWTEDCYHDSYAEAPRDGTAWAVPDCDKHVLRGGSWADFPRFFRSAVRLAYPRDLRLDLDGFRVARSLGP